MFAFLIIGPVADHRAPTLAAALEIAARLAVSYRCAVAVLSPGGARRYLVTP